MSSVEDEQKDQIEDGGSSTTDYEGMLKEAKGDTEASAEVPPISETPQGRSTKFPS